MTQRILFTCDFVIDQEAYREHCREQCNQPALLNHNSLSIGFFAGKHQYNVCAEHAALPLVELLKNVGELK